ncbi:MAG: HlyC/CorC family transporter [Chitinophagales bacterium]|nr:HlyC/CorC family transporter [Chitinophagales bacterium]
MISELLIIFVLVLINGLFAMAEIAMVSVRRSKLESAVKRGDIKAKLALAIHNDPPKFLSTVQVGITLISILLGVFSGEKVKEFFTGLFVQIEFLAPYAANISLTIVIILIIALTLIVGELIPKRIGMANPEPIAIYLAAPMTFLSTIAKPFIWFLTSSSGAIIKLFGIKSVSDDKVTEEEIKAIIQEGTETGAIEEIEQDIVERVFHLSDRKVSSLMTHHSDIVWLDINASVEKTMETIKSEVHSVYPVCDGDLDETKGIVYIKHLFLASATNQIEGLKNYINPVLFLPENNTAYSALEKFRVSQIHYALVIDEYGSVQGLVTINDILEAIVGEFDELNLPGTTILDRGDGSYLVDAGMPFYDFLHYFEIEEFEKLDDQEFNTVAGFIINALDRLPTEGEKIDWKEFEFEVVDMDATRIDKVIFKTKTEINDIDS